MSTGESFTKEYWLNLTDTMKTCWTRAILTITGQSHTNKDFLDLSYTNVYWLDQSSQIKVYLSRALNTTGAVDLTVKCLLTVSDQQFGKKVCVCVCVGK